MFPNVFNVSQCVRCFPIVGTGIFSMQSVLRSEVWFLPECGQINDGDGSQQPRRLVFLFDGTTLHVFGCTAVDGGHVDANGMDPPHVEGVAWVASMLWHSFCGDDQVGTKKQKRQLCVDREKNEEKTKGWWRRKKKGKRRWDRLHVRGKRDHRSNHTNLQRYCCVVEI